MESRSRGLLLLSFLLISFTSNAEVREGGVSQVASRDSQNVPLFKVRSIVYADIDTVNQRLYLVLDEGLWQYDLQGNKWTFLDSLTSLSRPPEHFQFGYNHGHGKLQFWSRGVGLMFEKDPEGGELKRVDDSFDHQNQYRHFPFFRNGMLHAFGGYGFWRWENIITYYNPEIREWSLYSVHPESVFPPGRIPFTGTYQPSSDDLYIFGGRYGEDGRPDGKHTKKVRSRDFWHFSFHTDRWNFKAQLEIPDMEFYLGSKEYNKVIRVNENTTSLYDSAAEMWYIPMGYSAIAANFISFLPVQLKPFTIHDPLSLEFGRTPGLLKVAPTNFLYNAPESEVIIVGVEMLSNSDQHPIRIVSISSDSLQAQIEPAAFIAGINWYYLLGGLSILLAMIAYIFWRWNRKEEPRDPELPYSTTDIREIKWLNREEKQLLEYLFKERRELESQEIEQLLWPEVKNYDYRRKLRNEIIRTINGKFQDRIDQRDLIIRQKDPDDKRRYLYSLNNELIADA